MKRSRILLIAVLLVTSVGIGVATLSFRPRPQNSSAGVIWTCSMHPQIRMDHFDRCPICGMDLIPVSQTGSAALLPANELSLTESGVRMANIETEELTRRKLFKTLRTVGKVDYDETALTYVTARMEGRVEEVFASFPGTNVKQGDHLVSIYSPELLATQSEFIEANRRERETRAGSNQPGGLAESARRRLELWGITPEQIDQLARRGVPEDHLVIYAPFGGTIVEKSIRPGQYVETGATLYRLADLSRVWLILEIFESDIAFVRFGQKVDVTLEGFPEQGMTGSVAFIEPVLNDQTRTVRVRVVLPNPDGRLKPGMYAQALLRIPILPDGNPGPTGLEGKYVCPMHPYVVRDAAGDCGVCGMPLERVPETQAGEQGSETLAVPADAVLTTGRRQLVFVDRGNGKFALASPQLGARADDYYPVLHGLEAGDHVVRRGNFLLDSQFQISGKPSLLYPEGMPSGEALAEQGAFSERAAQNLGKLPADDRALAEQQGRCPVTGNQLGSMGVPVRIAIDGQSLFLCCAACKEQAIEGGQQTLKSIRQAPPIAPQHTH